MMSGRPRPTPLLRVAAATITLAGTVLCAAAATPPADTTATRATAISTVTVYSAGSLRGVVADLAAQAGPALGIEIKAEAGGAGLMRERIENGEPADLFLSADLASPRRLQAEGRATLPVFVIARNRICVLSRRDAHVTPQNLVDRLLAQDVRIRTSRPVADPSGDYAWAIFDRIDALRPGAGAVLKQKAQANMDLAVRAAPGQNALAALFAAGRIDVTFSYCSGTAAVLNSAPAVTSFVIPPQLDPQPVFGGVVLSDKPAALRLALYLLSEPGQALVAKEGLLPLSDTPAAAP